MLALHSWIKDTLDVANGGWVLNFLEPVYAGWDVIRKYFEEEGCAA
jgi:hypothetical protein